MKPSAMAQGTPRGIEFIASLLRGPSTDDRLNAIRNALLFMNYAIILFTTILIAITTRNVCSDFKAYQLLSSFSSVPIPPDKLITVSQILFFLELSLIFYRNKVTSISPSLNLIFVFSDIAIGLLILYFMNISNKGILLLIITNIMFYVKNSRNKYRLLFLIILLYIFIDYDILSARLHLYSFWGYLDYYDAATRSLLSWTRNILDSLALVLFILFMIFEIQLYLEESTRVKELNKALFESTQKLRLSNIQLEEYSKRNEEMAKLKERNRLAREIHDTIGHYLTAINMGVKSCLKAIDHDPGLLQHQLSKVEEITRKSLVDVRRSIKELRPDALTRYSLHSAIENLVTEISHFSKTVVSFSIDGEAYMLNTQIEEFMYRVAQESISNAIRHSNPEHIDLQLSYLEDGLRFSVMNDGLQNRSIDPGFGLTHMKSKVEEFSGVFTAAVTPDLVFHLDVLIPYARRTDTRDPQG
jgi:signal transduction histidine kinase